MRWLWADCWLGLWISGAPWADDDTALGLNEVPGGVGVGVFVSSLVESGDLAPDWTIGEPPAKIKPVFELPVVVEDRGFLVWDVEAIGG